MRPTRLRSSIIGTPVGSGSPWIWLRSLGARLSDAYPSSFSGLTGESRRPPLPRNGTSWMPAGAGMTAAGGVGAGSWILDSGCRSALQRNRDRNRYRVFSFCRHSPAWPENPVRRPPAVSGNFTAACQRGRRLRDRDRSFFDFDCDRQPQNPSTTRLVRFLPRGRK